MMQLSAVFVVTLSMMRILIKTPVRGNYREVMARFDETLFKKLSPPGTPVRIVRFDGSHAGAIVHIEMKLAGFIPQEWISRITGAGEDESQSWFVDEGEKLPFFLSAWKHRHVVENEGENCVIIDDISFRTPFFLFDYLLYPLMYAQFAWRKPVYRKVFGALPIG
jgi:ligand-binding SRPBCC domain-containing protein